MEEKKKFCLIGKWRSVNNVGGGRMNRVFRLGIFLGSMKKLKKEKKMKHPTNGRYCIVVN